MVFGRIADAVFFVATAGILLGCTRTGSYTPAETDVMFSMTAPEPCLASASNDCGSPALSLLNPMENVDYLTRAELASEDAPQVERNVDSDANNEPKSSLADPEEE